MNRHAPDASPSHVTPAGADWLASASPFPRSVHALWAQRPGAAAVLPCGVAFDVVSFPALPGRRVLEQLWARGPGSGPAAAVRDRTLLFAAPGTAGRLPALLAWEEWRPGLPPALCHGPGDAVTVPPVYGRRERAGVAAARWLVAPDVRHPWLPGPRELLWGCVRAAGAAPEYRFSISGARVLKSSRRQAPLAQLVRAADS